MASSKDTNDEVEALGLDVESLVGMKTGDIRSLLGVLDADVALIVGTEGVPHGWPDEILDVDPVHDRLGWLFQAASGSWIPFYSYSFSRYVREFRKIPACIYTRRPVASPFALVRPIVDLFLDPDGTCLHASARWAETVLRQAHLGRDLEERASTASRATARPNGRPRFHATIERLEQMMGLVPPSSVIEVGGIPVGESGRLTIRMACIGEGLGFVVYDAHESPRLHLIVASSGIAQLFLVGASGYSPIATVPATGLRVAIAEPSAAARLWVDAYAGGLHLGIGDELGVERDVSAILLTGKSDASRADKRPSSVMLALMAASGGGPSTRSSASPPALRLDAAAGLLGIHDAAGVVRARLNASALDGVRAHYVFAEGHEDAQELRGPDLQ